ncbi:hypothetical protein [Jannaschia sp. R86511]|uniref:hypothetical protein n=1 Tax=Jannaschia sp. R86511 TaxID=3093853 RepID=UPI0036D25F4A
MTDLLGPLLVAGTALVVTAAVAAVLPALLLRAHLLDTPGSRSSHSAPTPRGGGIAVVAGVAAAAVVAALWQGATGTPGSPGAGTTDAVPVGWLVLLLAAGAGAGAVGLVDDVRGVRPLHRALAQLLVGAGVGVALVVALDVSWVWVPVAALATAAYVNAVNFMDGLNTMTGLHATTAGLAYALAGWLQHRANGDDTLWLVGAGLVVAAAGAAFLPFNGLGGGPARMFLGDVGSYAVGAMIALLAGAGFLTGLPVELAVAPLTVWLADTAHTLTLRMAAGERWYLPHRTHAYQRLTDAGWSHRQVAMAASGATLLAVAVAVAVADAALVWRLLGAVGLVLVGGLWVKLPAWLGHPSPWGKVARARRRR